MLSEQDKYQNILSQIHELNRQNLLTEYERNEHLINKLSDIESKINNNNNGITNDSLLKKLLYSTLFLILINLCLMFCIVFFYYNQNEKTNVELQVQSTENIEDIKLDKVDNNELSNIKPEDVVEIKEDVESTDDVTTFDKIELDENENFTDIKPIIKVDTEYTCEDDNYIKKYKIPYTVEIKGKLYSDKFIFILKNGNERKKCKINKDDI